MNSSITLSNHTFENNGLIADFMEKPRHQKYKTFFRVDNEDGSVGMVHAEDFKYHTSWDWLMPVVEKIDDMFGNDNQVDDSINKVHNAVLLFDIDEVYQAVIEFIESYE